VFDWAQEIKRVLPMVAGVTVMLIVTKPKDARSAISGMAVGLLVSYFVGDWLIVVAGFQPGTSTAASFITAFAGHAIAVRAADYLQSGKLPFIGGRNERE
jgi:Na+/proline symporter